MPATVIDNQTETTNRLMPMYRVILHNDDVSSMDHVCSALMETFKFEAEKAIQIMLEAHKTGCALVIVEPLETAELHQEQLQALSLTSTIEPET